MLPDIVRVLCWDFDAWVVGSAADPGKSNINDYDVIVPPGNWLAVANILHLLPITANSFGGWKVRLSAVTVDVWPCTINEFIARATTFPTYLYQPKCGLRLTCNPV